MKGLSKSEIEMKLIKDQFPDYQNIDQNVLAELNELLLTATDIPFMYAYSRNVMLHDYFETPYNRLVVKKFFQIEGWEVKFYGGLNDKEKYLEFS